MFKKLRKVIVSIVWQGKYLICCLLGHNPIKIGKSGLCDKDGNTIELFDLLQCKRCELYHETS